MKGSSWVFFIGLIGLMANMKAQEPIQPITRMLHTYDWYVEQANLWYAQIQKRPSDEYAWRNYYEANRAARNVNEGQSPRPLDEIMNEMGQAIPGTYQYHYLMYRNGGNNAKLIDHLHKAYKMDSTRPELWEEYLTYYELQANTTQRAHFNQKRYHANSIPLQLLTYNYNVLMSLPAQAILFTNGDNDTYPVWLLQDALNVRPDVLVLNIWLATDQTYLNARLKQHRIPPFEAKFADISSYHRSLSQHLHEKARKPLYYALTMSPHLIEDIKPNLYLEGLASRYSGDRYDNLKVLAKNVEEGFVMDQLRISFQYVQPGSGAFLPYQNYLLPLLRLRLYYKEKGMDHKLARLEETIWSVARMTNTETELKKALNQ